MLAIIQNEFRTLRPLVIVMGAAALGFGISAVYRSGYESGMLEAFHNDDAITQLEVNERVEQMKAGRDVEWEPQTGIKGVAGGEPLDREN